jgi:hypothetical protein
MKLTSTGSYIILQAQGQFEAITASLAPIHNHQQQKQSFVIANE